MQGDHRRQAIRGALVLRPAPDNARTAALLATAGVDTLVHPLFAVAPVAWRAPDPTGFDALLLTSANTVRHAGDGLSILAGLPVLAVGAATAVAARAAGLTVVMTGDRDAAALVASAGRFGRLLHLAGHDRVSLPGVASIAVYRSEELPIAPATVRQWQGRVVLLHSARAAHRLTALVDHDGVARTAIAVAAFSPAVLRAAGGGWRAKAVSDRPTDAALVACAVAIIDPPLGDVDKRAR